MFSAFSIIVKYLTGIKPDFTTYGAISGVHFELNGDNFFVPAHSQLTFLLMKVEEERDQKTEHFVQAAKEICGRSYTFLFCF
jgi:hypothetical protein